MNFLVRSSPKSLKLILIITFCISFLASLLPSWNPLIPYLSLTMPGIMQGYVWQLITHSFLEINFIQSNFSYLFHMFFYASLFWIIGSALIRQIQEKEFLYLYFTTSLVSGVSGLSYMYFSGFYSIAFGMSPILYAMIFSWLYFYPHLQFSIAYKIYPLKWIVLIVMGLNLYLDGSSGHWAPVIMNISAIIWSYILLKIRYKKPSPFPFIEKIENQFMKRDF